MIGVWERARKMDQPNRARGPAPAAATPAPVATVDPRPDATRFNDKVA